jgi:DNA-binding PadR family transcriptional regulator
MKADFDQFLPVSPAALHILMALVSEDRHGYGIMQEVARQSDGRYKLGPGTLYDNLQKLLESGIVEESPRRASAKDPRRRYYRLTGFGRRLLSTEITRLEGVVREARLQVSRNAMVHAIGLGLARRVASFPAACGATPLEGSTERSTDCKSVLESEISALLPFLHPNQ